MTLLDTVTAIRAGNAPDADLQIARAICTSFHAGIAQTPEAAAACERTAHQILPRMAAIAGPRLADELARVEAEMVDECRAVISAFVAVVHEFRANRESDLAA